MKYFLVEFMCDRRLSDIMHAWIKWLYLDDRALHGIFIAVSEIQIILKV